MLKKYLGIIARSQTYTEQIKCMTCLLQFSLEKPHFMFRLLYKNEARLPLSTCFHAGFLLDLFFDPKDGGDMFPETLFDFQRTTWRYITEDITL
jgi:hypothetical protein